MLQHLGKMSMQQHTFQTTVEEISTWGRMAECALVSEKDLCTGREQS